MANIEWLNQNAHRNYPFRENAALVSESGLRLPNSMILDCFVSVPSDQIDNVRLTSAVYSVNRLALTFTANVAAGYGPPSGETEIPLGPVVIDMTTHVYGRAYRFSGTDVSPYSDIRGVVVVGESGDDEPWVAGVYRFRRGDADGLSDLEPCLVRPLMQAVRYLEIESEGVVSGKIHGHIKLVAGTNINLTYDIVNNAVTVDAVGQPEFEAACDCPEEIAKHNVIKTINGIPVEDVVIVGDDCVKVETSGNTITVSDTCSSPCCGCPELEAITEALKILDVTVKNLQDYAGRLDTRISDFVTKVVLAINV